MLKQSECGLPIHKFEAAIPNALVTTLCGPVKCSKFPKGALHATYHSRPMTNQLGNNGPIRGQNGVT